MSNVTIVPAQPGFVVVYADGPELFLSEPVIAWAIEAEFLGQDKHFHAIAHPITPEGEPGTNYVGFQYPDGKVAILGGLADSLEAAQKDRAESFQREQAQAKQR